jgi:hypothetical protein
VIEWTWHLDALTQVVMEDSNSFAKKMKMMVDKQIMKVLE